MRFVPAVEDAELAGAIDRVVRSNGRRLRGLHALAGGRNNRVFHATTDSGDLFVKAFYRDASDPRDRMGAELAFTALAHRAAPERVAAVVAIDEEHGIAVFEYVEGRRLDVAEIDDARIDEAVDFVVDINAAGGAPSLPPASEACFTIDAHLKLVERRMARLSSMPARDELDARAGSLVADRIAPAWEHVRGHVEDEAPDLLRTLPRERRCASPSDFGYHNAILAAAPRGANAGLVFHDFEYAGIDDPAKLICDFHCQPEVPVPLRFAERFARGLVERLSLDEEDSRRVELLLPVYRIKWCCIMLAEFLADGRRRREFATGTAPSLEDRRRQLVGVERMLAASGAD